VKGVEMQKLEDRECSWQLKRMLSLRPRPPCDPPKWKVKVASNTPMFAGEVMYLCDYHKKNLALRFETVEKL
jgi:hypothetical protein